MQDETLEHVKSVLHLDELLLQTSREFGSETEGHRSRIRSSLSQTCKVEEINLLNDVNDLASRPQLEDWFVSISHTHDLGGFALSRTHLGFDIEQIEKIRSATVRRMCDEKEISSSPDVRLLWPAKEAAFKSIPLEKQPQVLSQIHVHSWGDFSEKLLNFRASFTTDVSNSFGSGLIFDSGEHYFSLFRYDLSTLV